MREQARAEGRSARYDGRWRDRDPAEAPAGVAAGDPPEGAARRARPIIDDRVQGEVRFDNAQLDDMVLLRSDGTPTYMLSVVVDDHDMGVTHIIRGDDHLVNAARQTQLYRAHGWTVPEFAHIPLIHGPDGAKLSKRHGALGVDAYREMGFLPEALRNYLLRLGWSHGDDEIISTEQAIAWFDLDAVGKGAARFDMAQPDQPQRATICARPTTRTLVGLIAPRLEAQGHRLDAQALGRLEAGMAGLKPRASTLVELAASATFYVAARPLALSDKAAQLLDATAPRASGGLGPGAESGRGMAASGAGAGGARLCSGPGSQARPDRAAAARRA